MDFFTEGFFLTQLNFLKGDTNIFFKKKRFLENHTYFVYKNFFFQLSFATFEQPYTGGQEFYLFI